MIKKIRKNRNEKLIKEFGFEKGFKLSLEYGRGKTIEEKSDWCKYVNNKKYYLEEYMIELSYKELKTYLTEFEKLIKKEQKEEDKDDTI